jgi:iron complex outermembrane receptor protein
MRKTAFALLVFALPAGAQDSSVAKLPPMVTVTRQPSRSPMDLPFGISTVSPDSARPGQAHVAADQALAMIPGVTVANRMNPSQDVRVSIRGFGARSNFGVRSIRVMRDGMPLTLPDGQTPLDYLDLESIGHIEVIRGTASALYGNASGGVIDIKSATPPDLRLVPEARVWVGSGNLRRTTAVGSGTSGSWAYQGNVGQTESDNYRQYSRQKLTNGFGRISTTIRGTDLSIVGLALHMPVAENPGALTAKQLDTMPSMADPSSVAKKARKEVDQLQVGVSANRRMGPATVSLATYGGARSLFNPIAPSVIEIGRSTAGASLRGDLELPWAGSSLAIGGDIQLQDDDRKNWTNCNGVKTVTATCPTLGEEKGVIGTDQQETVLGGGPYAQLQVERGRLRVNAGGRADAVRFKVQDRLITPTNPDDSGDRTLHAFSPMAGVAWRATRFASAYANYTTAFETPTTTELANQPDGSVGGFNASLRPQRSGTTEVGAKGVYRMLFYSVAAFRTRVRDELIAEQDSVTGDRNFFINAGRTARDGIEAELGTTIGRFDIAATHAFSSFRFVDYQPTPATQLAGKRIPGIPMHQTQAAVTGRFAKGGFVTIEGLAKARVWANDANSDSAFAKSFQVFNVRLGRDFSVGGVRVSPVAGVNNVLDTRYVGSVAINAVGSGTTAKFFEPAPGRTWITGARVWYKQ